VRAKIVLALADGATVSATAAKLATRRRIVQKWGKRFLKKRMDGLADDPRSGRPPRV
jgi:transposase